MSASMAEVLAGHWSASTHTDKKPFVDKCDGCGEVILTWGGEGDTWSSKDSDWLAAHQAEQLAANGYGKLEDATIEWGVRRDQDSAIYSREAAERTIEQQRKRKLHPILIKRQVGPWEVAE